VETAQNRVRNEEITGTFQTKITLQNGG